MMNNIRMKNRLTLFLLTVAVSLNLSTDVYGFTPWSQVEEYWVSADGKTPIDGAVEKGVTITKYQNKAGSINWRKMKADGISFVMILLEHDDDSDQYFDENVKGATNAGLKVGVFFYSSAKSQEEAEKEARYVLNIIKDYRISYPIGYNIESSPLISGKVNKEQVTEQINTFCHEIEDAGYRTLVYGNHEWISRYMDIRKIPYDIWYSRYGMANKYANRTMWRCTDNGKVNGIQGSVCLEFSFEDYQGAFQETGWRKINGVEYYFVKHQIAKSVTLTIDGQKYYFDRRGIATKR